MRDIRCWFGHRWNVCGSTLYWLLAESRADKQYVSCRNCGTRGVRIVTIKRPRDWEDLGILPGEAIQAKSAPDVVS